MDMEIANIFVVDNDQKAEWALKKVAEIDQEFNRLNEVCQKQLEYYRGKQLEYLEKRNNQRGSLVSLLAEYFEAVPSKAIKATKTQVTYKLPSGKLVKKLAKPELVKNEEELLELLKGTDYVEEKPCLKWGEYKKQLKIIPVSGDNSQEIAYKVIDENGEIVKGIAVEVKPETFDVDVIV